MKKLFYCIMFIFFFAACKKEKKIVGNDYPKVEIYMLKSFSVNVDQSAVIPIHSISNGVFADTVLIADGDIESYDQTLKTFRLAKNIKSIIKDYGPDKAFAVTVDKQPVYYGMFRPAYLNSMVFGIASIDPIIHTTENEIAIQYATIDRNLYLLQLDKRNDSRLISALQESDRLK